MILTSNLQFGIALGIASSMLNFVVVYSRQGTTTVAAAMTSKYRHKFDQRRMLREWQAHGKGVVVLSLRGFLFFGSSASPPQSLRPHSSTPWTHHSEGGQA